MRSSFEERTPSASSFHPRRPRPERKRPTSAKARPTPESASAPRFSFQEIPIFPRPRGQGGPHEPAPLEEFPHRATIERSLGITIPGLALHDAAGCQRWGVGAYTEDGVSHFKDPAPSLKMAAHEAAHQAQQLGLTNDAHLGAERHAQTVAKITAQHGSAQSLLGPAGAPVSTGIHFYTESKGDDENFIPKEPRPITHQVTVNTTLLQPAEDQIDSHLQTANAIYNRYGICIKQGTHKAIKPGDTALTLGKDLSLDEAKDPKTRSTEESELFKLNRTPGCVSAYFLPRTSVETERGHSYKKEGTLIINTALRSPSTLAHELGHVLIAGKDEHTKSPKIKKLIKDAVKDGKVREDKHFEEDLHTNKVISFDPQAPTDAKAQLNLMAPGHFRITEGENTNQLTRGQLRAILNSPFVKPV